MLQRAAGGRQIERGGNGGGGEQRRALPQAALFAQIFGQYVATQRNADRINPSVTAGEQREHVCDFGCITAVVHFLRRYAAAAAEMGDHAVPAARRHFLHQRHRIMAAAAAFEPVKQYD